MKLFIAHKVTGEEPKELEQTMKKIGKSLEKAGHNYYCTFLNNKTKGKSKGEILSNALEEMDKCDSILILANSNDKSEGTLMEVGYAIAKEKRIILALKAGVETRIADGTAHEIINFKKIEDLCPQLELIR